MGFNIWHMLHDSDCSCHPKKPICSIRKEDQWHAGFLGQLWDLHPGMFGDKNLISKLVQGHYNAFVYWLLKWPKSIIPICLRATFILLPASIFHFLVIIPVGPALITPWAIIAIRPKMENMLIVLKQLRCIEYGYCRHNPIWQNLYIDLPISYFI